MFNFQEASFPLVGNLSFIIILFARRFRTSRNDRTCIFSFPLCAIFIYSTFLRKNQIFSVISV